MTSRFIDFPTPLLGLDVAVSESVFWPMYEYTVGIKGLAGNESPVFETLILKFIDAGCTDPARMSLQTGLEMDFVQFLLQRLEHARYINDDLTLTPAAEQTLRQAAKSTDKIFYFLIYRDAISGQVMPVMIPRGSEQLLAAEDVLEQDADKAGSAPSFFKYKPINSAGKTDPEMHRVAAWRFPPENEPALPDSIEIQKLAANYARDTGKKTQAIRVEPVAMESQPVYVRVDVILQETNRRHWLVTDGFGGDLSPLLERALTGIDRDEQNWLKAQRNKLSSPRVSKQSNQSDSTSAPVKPMQEMIDCLRELQNDWRRYIEYPQTNDQLEEHRQIKNNSAIHCYKAFEWLLFYTAKKRPGEKYRIEQLYRMGNKETIGKFAANIAEELGFIMEPAVPSVPAARLRLQVKAGKIRESMKGQPELWSLMTLNLADAHEDSNHPLRGLADKHADLLLLLIALGQKRNAAAHGEQVEMSKDEIAVWMDRITACSAALLPDFDPGNVVESAAPETRGKSMTIQQQLRYEAEMRVEEELGLAVQRVVPHHIYSKLVRMEMCRTKEAVLFRPEVVGILYELLEQCSWQLLENVYTDPTLDVSHDAAVSLIQKVLQKAFHAGFKGSIEQLKAINSAAPERIRSSLAGRKNSLQAHCIAYLSKADPRELQQLARKLPYFLIEIDRIAALRKHGHIPNLDPATSRQVGTSVNLIFKLICHMESIHNW